MKRSYVASLAVLGLVAVFAAPAQAVPNPMGDTYTFTSTNLPGDDGPVSLTFDGIAENVGSATVNEAYWPWAGGVITGETYDDRGAGVQHYTDQLTSWEDEGALIEWTIENNVDGAGLHSNPFITSTSLFEDVDLNNGSAVPTVATDGFYFYFMDSGAAVPFQTGQLYFDTDIWVGEHPINAGQEVYYVDFAQSDIDTFLYGDYTSAGKFGLSYDIEREFGVPDANFFTLMGALILDVVMADPFADLDGLGIGILIMQDSPSLPGDGNGDGWVDGLDYLIWASNFGTVVAGGAADGDYDGSGFVDGLDYLDWAANFGTHVGTAVPEPGTFALAGLAMVGLLTTRRRLR